MSDNLKQKTLKGTAWSFVDNFITIGITFVVNIILARILSPAEFGLIGIITVFTAVFNSIVDCGFSSALIRKTNATSVDYNTIFYFNLLFSFFLAAALFFCSPIIADFFTNDELTPLLKAMSSIIIINGFAIIQRTILTKNVNFRTQAKISLISASTSGIIGITMAVSGGGVWSLAAQLISKQLLNTILLWVFNKWRPKKEFSFQSFKELFNFGWKLLASGIIDTIWNEIYTVVIGKFYTPATLGQYSKAVQFKNLCSNNLLSVVQRVYYPIFSSIKDERERLISVSSRMLKITMYISVVLMLGLSAASQNVILVLIGEKWLEAAKYLQIICFYGMLFPLQSINLDLLKVVGRSDIHLYLEIIKKIIGIGPLVIGIYISIEWMLWGSLVYNIINFFLNSYYVGRKVGYTSRMQIKDLTGIFVLGLTMFSIVLLLNNVTNTPIVSLLIQIIVGGLYVVIISEIFKFDSFLQIVDIAKTYSRKFTKR